MCVSLCRCRLAALSRAMVDLDRLIQSGGVTRLGHAVGESQVQRAWRVSRIAGGNWSSLSG